MDSIWTLLQQTAAAALTALFLLLLQRLFLDKLSPRWQYGVWSVLLLRLIVPAGIGGRSTSLDLWPWIDRLRVWAELRLSSAWSSPWVPSLPSAPWPLLPAGAPRSVTDWLFVVYLAGAAVCLAWFLLSTLRLHLRVGQGVPVAGERLELVRWVAEQYQLPLPRRVVECRWDHGPFLMGVLRPTLVLPMGWEAEEKVILHELLHLKYQDVLSGWVTTLFRCLHWCNPVLWYAFDKIGQDREVLCDQRVLERLEGEDRRDYGRCLLSMADDRALRIPGATTMANGARGVKARIEAIARFKRYPQGMGLVSGGITLILALALVAGAPVQALLEGSDGEVTTSRSLSAALSTGQRCRATTVAGALDAYGKGVLLQWSDRYTSLMCQAMVRPPEEMPQVLEQWKDPIQYGLDLDSMSYQEMMDTAFPSHNWWTTGPQFRGLVSDGQGGYLCQVLWYRDVDVSLFWTGDLPLPEEGQAWPVEYLCRTVWVRPDGRYWTVQCLAESRGNLENSPLRRVDERFFGPVTWTGEAEGITVTLSPAQSLESGDGMVGQDRLRDYAPSGGFWSFSTNGESQGPSEGPMPGTSFCSVYTGVYWTAENAGDRPCSLTLDVTPLWEGSDGLQTREPGETMAADPFRETLELGAGETAADLNGGGGASGMLGDDWDYFLAPDAFQAVLEIDSREVPLTLTKTYTTPDRGSYGLPGEEDAP